MRMTATEAKNRFGQVLEHAQRNPVVIEKAGRRHSVVLSAAQYDRLLKSALPASVSAAGEGGAAARDFYERYRDWVDMNNDLVERYGIFGEEHRVW